MIYINIKTINTKIIKFDLRGTYEYTVRYNYELISIWDLSFTKPFKDLNYITMHKNSTYIILPTTLIKSNTIETNTEKSSTHIV